MLAERAGLPGAPVHLEQLQTYGYPDRDPTRRAVSVAYLGLAPDLPAPDTPQMSWQPVSALTQMAFDHERILQDGVERARSKLEYTRWPRRSAGMSSPWPSSAGSTRSSGARRLTRATSTAR